MSSPHIGDDAELYVFGALEPHERAAVEAHIARCEECLRLVGRAEETLLAMEREAREVPIPSPGWAVETKRSRRAAPWWLVVAAAAAAFVAGILLPHPAPMQDEARVAMLNSHFNHAQFRGTPLAKVIYPRERSWYYVIVDGSHEYAVYGLAHGREVLLGGTIPSGATSELFIRTADRFDRVDLRENGRVVESAAIR